MMEVDNTTKTQRKEPPPLFFFTKRRISRQVGVLGLITIVAGFLSSGNKKPYCPSSNNTFPNKNIVSASNNLVVVGLGEESLSTPLQNNHHYYPKEEEDDLQDKTATRTSSRFHKNHWDDYRDQEKLYWTTAPLTLRYMFPRRHDQLDRKRIRFQEGAMSEHMYASLLKQKHYSHRQLGKKYRSYSGGKKQGSGKKIQQIQQTNSIANPTYTSHSRNGKKGKKRSSISGKKMGRIYTSKSNKYHTASPAPVALDMDDFLPPSLPPSIMSMKVSDFPSYYADITGEVLIPFPPNNGCSNTPDGKECDRPTRDI